VAADEDVGHAERLHGVLEHGEHVVVRRHHHVGDVAVDEHLALLRLCDHVRRDAGVGAADEEVVRPVLGGEPLEELRVGLEGVGHPLSVVLENASVRHGAILG
jgi:hypothetical protein